MTKWSQKLWVIKSILIVTLISVLNLAAQCSKATPTTPTPSGFAYQVRVQAKDTGADIPNALVTIEAGDKAPLLRPTDNYGLAVIFIDYSYAGQLGVLRVEADNYEKYWRYVNLTKDALPEVVPLVPTQTASPAYGPTPKPPTPTDTPAPEIPPSREKSPWGEVTIVYASPTHSIDKPTVPPTTSTPKPPPLVEEPPPAEEPPPPAGEPPPAEEPPPSKLSGRLAYALDVGYPLHDVYIVDTEGNTLARISSARQPALSPDGQLITVNGEGEMANLLIANADGSNIHAVTSYVEDGQPSWSPNGLQLIFSSQRGSNRESNLIIHKELKLSDDIYDVWLGYGGGDRALLGEYPFWMHDWRIVYKGCNYYSGGDKSCGLRIVGSNGGIPFDLTREGADTAPAAHEDRIAFMSTRDGNWEIYTVNADGSGLFRLTDNAFNDGLPAWSPDGRHIAFLSDEGGRWGIWVMAASGSGRRKLFDIPSTQGTIPKDWPGERLSWSP